MVDTKEGRKQEWSGRGPVSGFYRPLPNPAATPLLPGLSHGSLIYLASYLPLPLLHKKVETAYKITQNKGWTK